MHRQEVEHECPLRMGVEPRHHFGGPVRADRVQNQVDRLAHRRLFVEQGQQFAELARTVLEADHAAHPAIVDSEASQQIHGAVALVLELAPRWPTPRWRPTWYLRLVWRRRLANANAGLLVHTEQRPVGGWAEQQLDDRYGFGGELRITIVHPGVKDGPGEPGAA